MQHVPGTYRFLAALVSLSVLLSIALPTASQAYMVAGGDEAPVQHATTGMDACDHGTMPRDMQCGCCTAKAPMPELPEALLQSNTLKHFISPPPAARADIAPLFEDAGAGGLAPSGVHISRSLRLHVLHATFLN